MLRKCLSVFSTDKQLENEIRFNGHKKMLGILLDIFCFVSVYELKLATSNYFKKLYWLTKPDENIWGVYSKKLKATRKKTMRTSKSSITS